MNRGRVTLASAALTAAATPLVGWWAPFAVGLGWSVLRPAAGAGALGIGAALGWAGILVWRGMNGPLLTLADRLGGVTGVPGWALLAAVPVAAGLAGWSAAVLGAWLRTVGARS